MNEHDESRSRDDDVMRTDPPTPVILLNRYSHFAATAWANRIPMEGSYDVKSHWAWLATLWRGMVGPDLTVYIRDVSPEVFAKGRTLEYLPELHLILVLREKNNLDQKSVDDSSLRRLDFEVSEWIRVFQSKRGKP